MLKTNSTLIYLNLCDNPIGYTEYSLSRDWLKYNTSIQFFYFYDTGDIIDTKIIYNNVGKDFFCHN